jgi:glutamate/aspartate transport system permease protein
MDTLITGTKWTLVTALMAWILALALGLVVGTVLTMPNKTAARIANAYIELFRNIPLLVQMFIWYFVVPEIVPASIGNWLKQLQNAPFIFAVLSLGFFTSSRVAVQVRTGINALPRGQLMAGTALGLTLVQTYRYILLPQAGRIIIPPMTSEFLNIIKNSAVALTIGLVELTASARSMQEFSFQTFEAFTAPTIIYIAINVVVVNFMRLIERAVRVPGLIGPADTGAH